MDFQTIYSYRLAESSMLTLTPTPTHCLAIISVKKLLQLQNIQNWKYNRPPDNVRVVKMAEYMVTNRPMLDTMIYCNYNSITNKYEIYDGIHRLTTLKYIVEQHEKDKHDYMNNSIYMHSIDWLLYRTLLFNIRVNATEGEIMEIFMSLNKSVPIPELYIENPSEKKRLCVEKTVEIYQQMYKTHFSPSVKVQRPNTNRESFTNFVSQIYDFILPSCENELIQQLDEINNDVRTQVLEMETDSKRMKKYKITAGMISKCKASNCYLFMENLDNLLSNFS